MGLQDMFDGRTNIVSQTFGYQFRLLNHAEGVVIESKLIGIGIIILGFVITLEFREPSLSPLLYKAKNCVQYLINISIFFPVWFQRKLI